MRVFLCDYEDFYLAIPMHSVASMALYLDEEAQPDMFTYIEYLQSTFVSLPHLFNLPDNRIRHYITLKNDEAENTTVLLSTEVICETDIPAGAIYPVPKIFSNTRFFLLFNGINVASCNPILLLNPEGLVQFIQKEMAL